MRDSTAVLKNQNGAVAIIVAVMLMAFLGFTAIVVDVGYLYEVKRQLQSAADAGALAGCQEMVLQAKDPDVIALSETVANDYTINKNHAEEATPTVDLNDQSVTVVAGRTVDLFFAQVLGISSGRVQAVAKAEVAYLIGVKDLDPMGVPNPKPKNVKVEVVNQSTGQVYGPYLLGGGNFVDDTYIYLSDIPVPPAGDYRVDVIRTNNQDAEDKLVGASALVVSTGSQVGEVKVSPNFITAGTPTSVTITAEVAGNPSEVEAVWGNGNNKATLIKQGATSTYQATAIVDLSTSSDGYGAYPIAIKVDGVEAASKTAYIVAHDASLEVEDVDLGANYVIDGAQSTVSVNVKIQGFEYEQVYTLFLDNGTNLSGNYFGLDLDYAEYAPGTGEPDSPTGGHGNGSGGNAFHDALAGLLHSDPWAPTHPIHYYRVGDYIWTKTGGMVGPLDDGIEDRIGTDQCTWESWKANTPPTSTSHTGKSQCPRLMTVPLVEDTTYEAEHGVSKVRIVGFAQFFISSAPDGGALQGVFIEYVKGGVYQKTPPPEPNIKTIHLVKPDGES